MSDATPPVDAPATTKTERALLRALELSVRRSQVLAEVASDVSIVLDDDGLVLFASASLARVLGRLPADLVGTPFGLLVHPDDLKGGSAELEAGLAGGRAASTEWRLQHADGSWRVVEERLSDLTRDPAIGGFVANLRDISDRVHLEEQLARQALEDSLTSLPNRALLHDRLQRALARMPSLGSVVRVMIVDVDRFRLVNDTLGHDAGDHLLGVVASRLRELVRGDDTVARLRGDTFVVVAERGGAAGDDDLVDLAERITKAIAVPIDVLDRQLVVTVSTGIAVQNPGDIATSADLLRAADIALHGAKAQGGGCWLAFDGEATSAVDRPNLEGDLRAAIEAGQLRIHYQPVVSMQGRIDGVEALVRWEHPVRGLLPPGEFIALAESTGLITPIGSWVLTHACRQVAQWRREMMPDLKVAVNLSGRQLSELGLAHEVARVLDETALEPSALSLEITETALVTDPLTALRLVTEIRALGVRIAVDDFGTGYSSLLQLRTFPVQVLKLDRSFVAGLGVHTEDSVIIGSVIELAHSLGLEAVAEGVETVAQARSLEALGCDFAQGFLWSRPLPPVELETCLAIEGALGSEDWQPTIEATRHIRGVVPEPGQHRRRVLVVGSKTHPAASLRPSLEQSGSFVIVGESGIGDFAVMMARRVQPDVLILDLSDSGAECLDWIPELRWAAGRANLVVLVNSDADESLCIQALEMGASGCILASLRDESLVRALTGLRARTNPQTLSAFSHEGVASSFDPLIESSTDMLELALAGEHRLAARRMVKLASSGTRMSDLVRMLALVQHEVGDRWERGISTVVDEHVATSVVLGALQAVSSFQPLGQSRGVLVVTCPAGEVHTMPGYMITEELRHVGWRVIFVGGSAPAADVGGVLDLHEPLALLVTASMTSRLPGVARLVEAAHLRQIPVLGGGQALLHRPEAALTLGLDAVAPDASSASSILTSWASSPLATLQVASSASGGFLLDSLAQAIAGSIGWETLEIPGPEDRTVRHLQADARHEYLILAVREAAAAELVGDDTIWLGFESWMHRLFVSRDVPVDAWHRTLASLIPRIAEVDRHAGERVARLLGAEIGAVA